jgi:2-alkyl-3-oxoalkanoate reductase
MKILISGASGGLGRELINGFLARGDEIIAMGRNPIIAQSLKQNGVNFIIHDLQKNKLPNLEGIDFIIHAAALSSPWGRWRDFYDINFLATKKLYEAAKTAKVKGFVFVSSPSVYAQEFAQLGICEHNPPAKNPMNYYAQTKKLAEEFLLSQKNEYPKTIIIRPRAIIGPNDNVLLPRFLRLIEKGRFPLFNNGDALIEPTDVRDVVAAIILCVEKSETLHREVFNISGGISMPLREMIIQIAGAMKKEIIFKKINYKIARNIVKILEKFCQILPNYPEPPLTPYSLCAISFSQTFDLTKSREILGFVPKYNAFDTANAIAREIGKGSLK